jgi:hypothetical protein
MRPAGALSPFSSTGGGWLSIDKEAINDMFNDMF